MSATGTSAPLVSFDLDGVIMRGPFASSLRPRIWEHLGRGANLAHLAAEEREREIWAAVRDEHDRRLLAQDHVGAWNWQEIYNTVSLAFGGEPLTDLDSLVKEACQIDDSIALLPGAWTGLQRLTSAGVHVVAVTNGYRMFQWPVLERLGVAEFFDAVITPDVAGFAKPDPRVFGLVDGLLAHVGDLLLHDVLAANQAGLHSIWLDADLPQMYVALGPLERPRAPGFLDYLARAVDESRYRRFHADVMVEQIVPSAVVRDVDEAASVVLESVAAWTSRPR
jgi:putative hydrolase of the HAD superfamily